MTDAESPLAPIQQTIYDRLTGDATLNGMVTGIYDFVPEPAPYPYVTLGEVTVIPSNVHGRFGREVVVTLHIWTRSRGHAEGLAIEDRITQLLDHQPLTLDGHHTVSVRYEFSQTLIDPVEPSGQVRHIPLRFRITTEQDD